MSTQTENELVNKELVCDLMTLVVKLDQADYYNKMVGDYNESLLDILKEGISELSYLGVDRGIEILVMMLSKCKYEVTYKGDNHDGY